MLKALVLKELRETAWIARWGLWRTWPSWPIAPATPFCRSGPTRGQPRNSLSRQRLPGVLLLCLRRACRGLGVAADGRGIGPRHMVVSAAPPGERAAGARRQACRRRRDCTCSAAWSPILSYAAWAAMPGKHASPFFWWMTADAWKAWGVIASSTWPPFWPAFGRRVGSARGSCPWRRAGLLAVVLVFASSSGRCWASPRFSW